MLIDFLVKIARLKVTKARAISKGRVENRQTPSGVVGRNYLSGVFENRLFNARQTRVVRPTFGGAGRVVRLVMTGQL